MRVPFHVDDAVAKTRLQTVGYGAFAAVKLYVVFVVDEAQGIVAGDGIAAGGENQAGQVVVVHKERLFLVEVLAYHDEAGLGVLFFGRGSFGLLARSKEGHVFAPAFLV